MHAHTLPVGIIHRTHAIFFFRPVSHEGTHTHPPLHHIGHSLSLTCMCNDRCSSMCVCVCVCIARSFIVFHINRSIYISSEVSPSFPRPHRSIYTSLYRITYIANTPTLNIHPTSPSHHPCLPLHLSDARTMAKTGGSKGPAPLTSLYIEANMNVIIRQLLVKMV